MESQQITAEWARQLCFDAFGVKDPACVIFVDPKLSMWRIADYYHPLGIKTIELVTWYDFINQEYSHFGYDLETKTFVICQNTQK